MRFFQQIFKRYQQSDSGPQEMELVDRWYDATANAPRPDWMDADNIRQAKATSWQNISRNLAAPPRHATLRAVLRYAAAAMVAGLGLWGALYRGSNTSVPEQQTFTIYTAAPGTRKHLTLPDGTEIWLNNGSSIKLSNTPTLREAWLSEGEAYFQVAKNPQRPFIVHVDSLQTRVLGTAFNIKAYRSLPQMQLTVTEGKVLVGYHQAILDTLSRNMQLDFYPATGEFAVTTAGISVDAGWWNDRFVLDNAGFGELALRLKLKYGVTILSRNNRILQTAFSATFPAQTRLENVLETLCALYDTEYSLKGDTLIIQ